MVTEKEENIMYFTGWQDSEVCTKYVYARLHEILDESDDNQMMQKLSMLYDEMARTYFADTGEKIGSPKISVGAHNIL
tara:strand:+ start:595 stop:828 length:234 start_codon:yes stop_codon:yes gene_type:complete